MKLYFIGTNFKKGKGGVASVLSEYSKLFPEATFISSTNSGTKISNLFTLTICLVKVFWISLSSKNACFHIHGASYYSFHRKVLIYRIIRLFKHKVIYHIHGGEFHVFYKNANPKTKKKIKWFLENVDAVICLSSQWKAFFSDNFSIPKLYVVNNIVSKPTDLEQTRSTDVVSFLFLGYISERKGVWELLKAVEAIKETHSSFKIVIGGNGETEKLQRMIQDLGLVDFVNFIGWTSGEQKIDLLRNSDVFILPSQNEGLPISILEAMSYGLPIISTKVGGIPEVIENNVNGILINPNNLDELIQSMIFAIENPEVRVEFGQNNELRIQKFYPDSVKKQLEEIYNNI